MSISMQQITGIMQQKTIKRKSRDITIFTIEMDDRREVLARSEASLTPFLGKKVKAEGIVDGQVFFVHLIELTE
jgi:hypothetical protein